MKSETFFTVSSLVFTIVAIAHLLRVLMGFNLIVANYAVPLWMNTVAFFIAGSLAIFGIRLRRKKPNQ